MSLTFQAKTLPSFSSRFGKMKVFGLSLLLFLSLVVSANAANIPIGNSPTQGSANAPITIVEFTDFQCPYCVRGSRTLKQVKAHYGDKVRFVYKSFPLSFHRNARPAANAAMAAHAQGQFWPFYEKLFANYRNLMPTKYVAFSKSLGLDSLAVLSAVNTKRYKAAIDADIALGKRLGVRGTPTFFINGQKLVGAQPLSKFKSILDGILSGKPYVAPTRRIVRKPRFPTTVKHSRQRVPIAGAPALGDDQALVTIVEFSDFQCPFCRRASNTLKVLKRHYGSKLRLVFRHNPLSFHKQAHLAAQASMFAHEEGRFWDYHDVLLRNYRKLGQKQLLSYAMDLGLDASQMYNALSSKRLKERINSDRQMARKFGARGTPTFFINGRKLVGAQPESKFRQFIDEEIVVAKELLRKGIPQSQLYNKILFLTLKPRPRPKYPKPVRRKRPKKKKYQRVPLGNSPMIGEPNALVTIVEFSDFQCPYCIRASKTMKKLLAIYPGKVQIVFRQFPLSFHRNAHLAAQASISAHLQGKFWPFHDRLFKNYRNLSKSKIMELARQLDMDLETLKRDLAYGTHKGRVNEDIKVGKSLGVRGTPNFFVNGRMVSGARPLAHFKKIVNTELLRANSLLEAGVPRSRIYEAAMMQIRPDGSLKSASARLLLGRIHREYVPPTQPKSNYIPPEHAPIRPKPISRTLQILLKRIGREKNHLVPKSIKPKQIPIGFSPVEGPADALATLIIFTDYQCPFCAKYDRRLEKVKTKFKGKIRIVYKNYPLSFHKQAFRAAEAAMAAHAQGKFFAFQKLLFKQNRKLDKSIYYWLAVVLNLDVKRFQLELESGTYRSIVQDDMKLAKKLKVTGTPTIFLNGVRLRSSSLVGISKQINLVLNPPPAKPVPVKPVPTSLPSLR